MNSHPQGEVPSEFAFIDWVRARAGSRPELLTGIGDDAAVLQADGLQWVSTVDVITEGVHFASEATPHAIGRKAVLVNLSDLAAMAATPCAAFVGAVFPRNRPRDYREAVFEGILDAASEWNLALAGGDTNSWDHGLVLSITLLGTCQPGQSALRSGARPGDWIFVTGALGGSLPSDRHFQFTPRINEALHLQAAGPITAMLDLSDGLSSDLFHILNASRVGAVLDAQTIPIHADVAADLPHDLRLQHALNDGEDFELLLTVPAEIGSRWVQTAPIEIPLTRIGEIIAEAGCWLVDGTTRRPLPRGGWSHSLSEEI